MNDYFAITIFFFSFFFFLSFMPRTLSSDTSWKRGHHYEPRYTTWDRLALSGENYLVYFILYTTTRIDWRGALAFIVT